MPDNTDTVKQETFAGLSHEKYYGTEGTQLPNDQYHQPAQIIKNIRISITA